MDHSRTDTPTAEEKEQRWEHLARRPSLSGREQPPLPPASFLRSPPLEEENLTSSSDDSDSYDEGTSRRAPHFRPFEKFPTQRPGLRDDEADEDDTPAFLPMSREAETAPRDRTVQVLSATLRSDAERTTAAHEHVADRPGSRIPVAPESSASSLSSGAPIDLSRVESRSTGQITGRPGSHRATEASHRSPRKSLAPGKEPSDGTPSMGSSFSDLDGKSETLDCVLYILIGSDQMPALRSRR